MFLAPAEFFFLGVKIGYFSLKLCYMLFSFLGLVEVMIRVCLYQFSTSFWNVRIGVIYCLFSNPHETCDFHMG